MDKDDVVTSAPYFRPNQYTTEKPPSPMADYYNKNLRHGVGGWRPGAGRKKGVILVSPEDRRMMVQVRLPQYVIDWMYTQDKSLTKVVEHAIMREMYRVLGAIEQEDVKED